jgi:ligand-binding SRPBCC domain-containing protein
LHGEFFALRWSVVTTHIFVTELWLPAPREHVFPFFADARNLEIITPPWLNFNVLTPGHIEMRVGAVIDYRLRVHGLPVRWRTEITGWDPPHSFNDEQRRGPYRRWSHTHTFLDKDGGTLCRDEVVYAVPGGALANWIFVRHDVKKIFAYRAMVLKKQFDAKN